MNENNNRITAKKLTIDDLFISDYQKEIAETKTQAKILQCTVLMITFILLMIFLPGEL